MPNPRAFFFNVPGHGHVDPSLPLVRELTRRGHRIDYFATPAFQAKVEAAGAVYRPTPGVGDDYFEERGLDGSRPMAAAHALIETTGRILPDLAEEARRTAPDYILFDGMCPWGYFTARASRLPAVASISLMAPIRPPLRALLAPPMLSLVLSVLTKDFGKGLAADRLSRALGKQHGVKPPGLQSILNGEGDLTIVYTSAAFQPYSETAPASVRFVGRSPDAGHIGNARHPALLTGLNGRPLIYVSLGSVINRNKAFFETCIAAFADREEAVLITTGNAFTAADFAPLPANVSVERWVPQSAVLERATLFITHGGLNSVHDGLLFGVPMLLVPQQEEQTLNANRAVELGAGLMLRPGQVSRQSLLSHAGRLISEPAFRENARRLGQSMQSAGGVGRAADEIEALLNGARS